MFPTALRLGSRTTYRGSRGSGAGASTRTTSFSSPKSRNTSLAPLALGTIFKRSQRGLYDGRVIQSGHNVPKSRQKTARTWSPNIQPKRLYSETIGQFVKTRVATSALRTMDKLGGLDQYLANTRPEKLGEWGRGLQETLAGRLKSLRLKEESQERREEQERMAEEKQRVKAERRKIEAQGRKEKGERRRQQKARKHERLLEKHQVQKKQREEARAQEAEKRIAQEAESKKVEA